MPLEGEATVAVVPGNLLKIKRIPEDLEELAHRILRDPSGEFSGVVHARGLYSDIDFVSVKQPFVLGGVNETLKKQFSYFARTDHKVFRITLMFNADDRRSSYYEKTVRDLLLSLHSERATQNRQ
jgi:hypothetical protein